MSKEPLKNLKNANPIGNKNDCNQIFWYCSSGLNKLAQVFWLAREVALFEIKNQEDFCFCINLSHLGLEIKERRENQLER